MILEWGGSKLAFVKSEDRLVAVRSFTVPILLQKLEWSFPVPVDVVYPWQSNTDPPPYAAWDKRAVQWETGSLIGNGIVAVMEFIPPPGTNLDSLAENARLRVTYMPATRSSYCRVFGLEGETFTDTVRRNSGCQIEDRVITFSPDAKEVEFSLVHSGEIISIAVALENAVLYGVWYDTPEGSSKLVRSRDGRTVGIEAQCIGNLMFKLAVDDGDQAAACARIIIQSPRVNKGQSFIPPARSVSVPAPVPEVKADTPVVSVIIPAYNRRHCLFSTLASVFAQTMQDFEVLVVDDASTDNTEGETAWFRAAFPGKLRYIRLSNNQGESYARNVGLDHARGEFIAFLDSDDQWEPSYLEEMVSYLNTHAAKHLVWCYVDFYTVSEDGSSKPEQYSWINLPDQPWDTVHDKLWLGPQHVVYRRSAALRYDPDIDKAEDAELYTRMLAAGYQFGNLQKNLVSIYHHADSQNRANSFGSANKKKKRKASRNQTKAILSERTNLASLCMLTWNRGDIAPSVLSNLSETAGAPFEFIIVDNGSVDGMPVWLDTRYDELVLKHHKVILNPWNVGIPSGLNQGLLVGEGDLFLHAASDIFMEKDFLCKLMDAFNTVSDLGVAGVLYDKITASTYRTIKLNGIELNELVPDREGLIPSIGPAICLPRDVLARLGYWNEELGRYGREDTLMCRRAKAAGYRVAYLSDSVAAHRRENESPQADSAASEAKRKALAVTKNYVLDYSHSLCDGDGTLINKSINDHFNIVGSGVPAIPIRLNPPLATLVFTLRSTNLAMVRRAVNTTLRTNTPVEVVFVCLNADPKVVKWALDERRKLMYDGTLAHVCNYRGNWGIAKAYNAALGYSHAPFIVTLNDDIVADEDWLEPLLSMAGRPGVGYVCSNLSQHRAYLAGDYTVKTPEQIQGTGSQAIRGKNFVGFASVIERRKLYTVGVFDEATHIYHAETDMAARLEAVGLQPYEVLDSRVLHLRAASTGFAEKAMRNMANAHKPNSLR